MFCCHLLSMSFALERDMIGRRNRQMLPCQNNFYRNEGGKDLLNESAQLSRVVNIERGAKSDFTDLL